MLKGLLIVVLLVLSATVQGQQKADTPPVVTVQMSYDEKASIDAAQKAVDDAQAVLLAAKQKQDELEYKVIQRYREKLDLPWADCEASIMHLYDFKNLPLVQQYNSEDARGFLARRQGKWIIFTRGFSICQGL